MILYINTTKKDLVEVGVKQNGKILALKEFPAKRAQAEVLLPAVKKMLAICKIKLSDLKEIEVENGKSALTKDGTKPAGVSFTALRIGIVTANALGYALGIPVKSGGKALKSNIVKPIYYSEPNIT